MAVHGPLWKQSPLQSDNSSPGSPGWPGHLPRLPGHRYYSGAGGASHHHTYWVFTQLWPQNGNILVWAQLSPGLTCCHQMLTGDRRLPTFQTNFNHKNILANEAGSEGRRNNQISRLILLSWETIIVCIVVTCEVWRGHWEDIWCGRCYPHLLSSHWIIVVRGGGDRGGVEPMAKGWVWIKSMFSIELEHAFFLLRMESLDFLENSLSPPRVSAMIMKCKYLQMIRVLRVLVAPLPPHCHQPPSFVGPHLCRWSGDAWYTIITR